MKHIKFLTLTTLVPLTLVPAIATSCNKKEFDGKLTKEEMDNAVNNVLDWGKWNYTCDGKIEAYEQGEKIEESTFNSNFATNGVKIVTDANSDDEFYLKNYDHKWFELHYNNETKKYRVTDQLGNTPLICDNLDPWKMLYVIKDYLSDMRFSEKNKGYYFQYTYEETSTLFFIKFSSDKNLNQIVLDLKENKSNIEAFYEFDLHDFGSTKQIDFPFEDKDVEYPADTPLMYDSEKKYYVNNNPTEVKLHCGCTFSANSALLKPTKIIVFDASATKETKMNLINVSIYVNNVKSSCTFTFDSDKREVTINGLTLNENDKVQLIWNTNDSVGYTDTYQIQIS